MPERTTTPGAQLAALRLALREIEGRPQAFAREHLLELMASDPDAAADVTLACAEMLAIAFRAAAVRDETRPAHMLAMVVSACELRGEVDVKRVL